MGGPAFSPLDEANEAAADDTQGLIGDGLTVWGDSVREPAGSPHRLQFRSGDQPINNLVGSRRLPFEKKWAENPGRAVFNSVRSREGRPFQGNPSI